MQDDKHQHKNDSSLSELRGLLDDFATGELTDTQNARLQLLAIESEASWRLYLQYMFMYGKIHQKYCNHDKRLVILDSLVDLPENEEQNNTSPPNHSIFPLLDLENDLLSSCRDTDELGKGTASNPNGGTSGGILGNINFSFMPRLIMVVLGILILSLLIVLPGYWSKSSRELQWNVVAQVTKNVDCYWKQGSIQPTVGSILIPGQKLELECGLAELEFVSGTKVILQGPADFTIDGENASSLALGRLTAVVPERAKGFAVDTLNMNVVDLGTEFGMVVEENGNVDVHVFKGEVKTRITDPIVPVKNKKAKSQEYFLKKNQAVQYDTTTNNVTTIPADEDRFVRSLDRTGVAANLRVTNPSFELPDIRSVSEFQPIIGSTMFRPIDGWKLSDLNSSKSRVAMYQISPYTSKNTDNNVGPGATDGQQVATISLGTKPSPEGQPRSNWIYQSLGIITSDDINKKLKLTVDAGPRNAYGGLEQGDGTVLAAFALHVNQKRHGKLIGKPDSFRPTGEIKQLHQLEATVRITREFVGQNLFILLEASDNNQGQKTCQYHFDNVKVVKY